MVRADLSKPTVPSAVECLKSTIPCSQMSEKKKLCHQEALDLLQNLLSEINAVLTDDFSDEEVPENYLLEFSLVSLDDDHKTEL
ncbi:hypothetical protein TNCV_745421 [Trichonephila clavipes]|nr:hypothetical protein TNCV_745421 [Trichonephila clavipes]